MYIHISKQIITQQNIKIKIKIKPDNYPNLKLAWEIMIGHNNI